MFCNIGSSSSVEKEKSSSLTWNQFSSSRQIVQTSISSVSGGTYLHCLPARYSLTVVVGRIKMLHRVRRMP